MALQTATMLVIIDMKAGVFILDYSDMEFKINNLDLQYNN